MILSTGMRTAYLPFISSGLEQDTRRLYLCAKSIFSQFGYEIQFIAQCGRLPYFLYQKSDADSVPFRRIEGLQAVLIGNDYVLWQGY